MALQEVRASPPENAAKSIRQELGAHSKLLAMTHRRFFIAAALVITTGGLLVAQQNKSKAGVEQERFGARDGRPVILYTLKNSHGVEVRAMNYGGIIQAIRVPDRKGNFADIVLGHDTAEGYMPIRRTLEQSLDATPTALPMAPSRWTARLITCRRTTDQTRCTAEPPARSIRSCGKASRSKTRMAYASNF